jgi:predicted ribosome quality control (RQC) complex YloA/Tae2 family protein
LIRHYLTFLHQAASIDRELAGWTLAECWSQQKNQLTLRFIEGVVSRFVEVSLDLKIGYALLRSQVARARKNTLDFFSAALGMRLEGASIDEGERIIRLHFAGGASLVLVLFGGGSGNVYFVRDGAIVESLQSHDESETDAALAERLPEPRSRAEIVERLRATTDEPVRALMRAIPELGRRLAVEALHRCGMSGVGSIAELDEARQADLLAMVDELYGAAEASALFRIYHLPDEKVLSLIALESIADQAEEVEEFRDIGAAVRAYRAVVYYTQNIESLRTQLAKRVAAERGRLVRMLEKSRQNAEHAQRADEYELYGSLLLANLYSIVKGSDRIVVQDYEGAERTITLDPKLTPAANAERYFARARKTRGAAAQAETQRVRHEAKLAAVEALAERIARASSVDELETIATESGGTVRMDNEPKEKGTAERFRKFIVAGGHEVYAGKSASNNDELTVRFAKPNDYWFHARGSSGSHVVLKWSDPKSKPPREAIRGAASIAAYYSGSKNAKMVPVAYTLKKYVRKPKGSAVGAVVMDREEVVMVEPKLPEEGTNGPRD